MIFTCVFLVLLLPFAVLHHWKLWPCGFLGHHWKWVLGTFFGASYLGMSVDIAFYVGWIIFFADL